MIDDPKIEAAATQAIEESYESMLPVDAVPSDPTEAMRLNRYFKFLFEAGVMYGRQNPRSEP